MKLTIVLLASLACASSATAQYFSEGWQPGEAVPTETPSTPASAPVPTDDIPLPKRTAATSAFDLTRILESGPVVSLFGKFGLNITEKVAEARLKTENLWDRRIPLITDDNYDDLIVNENLSPEEEGKRLWFVLITAQAGQQSGISKVLDEKFDEAYNITKHENDIPDVKWGRIDYFDVTYLTTKWNIWQAPYIVVIKDRGQELYFFQATNIGITPEFLRDFLKLETWKNSVPWKTPFSPGGQYEKYQHYYALAMRKSYEIFIVIPRWLVLILSGVVAQFFMKILHRNPATEVSMTREEERRLKSKEAKEAKLKLEKEAKDGEGKDEVKASGSTPSKGKAKSRRGGKK